MFDRQTNNLKILQCNIQSLYSNKSELQRVMTSSNYGIALLSETWTKKDLELTSRYRVAGYHHIFHSRDDSYGGTAIMLKNCYNYHPISMPVVSNSTQVVAIRIATIDIVVVSIYVTPSVTNATFEDDMTKIFGSLRSFRKIIIGGVLNAINF